MVKVTIFRGHNFHGGGEEITDVELPTVPRIGETVSLFDNDRATFEKVTDVNYHCSNGSALVRILLRPTGGKMEQVSIGGI